MATGHDCLRVGGVEESDVLLLSGSIDVGFAL
jgi:hypothetical protein